MHHLTSWCVIVTLLNKIGHCCSYDKLCAANTRITADVLPKVDKYGTVVLPNIPSGPFLQLAADNTDNNEETLAGKNTTHAASMVVFQRQPNGPEPPPVQLANHNMTGNDFYREGEEFMSYKSVLHLEDDLKSFFIQVRLNKSGFKKIMSCLSQHVVLIKYGKS